MIRHRKMTALSALLVVVAAACGGSSLDLSSVAESASSTTSGPATSAQSPSTTAPPLDTTTTAAVETTTVAPSATPPPTSAPDLDLPVLVMVDGNTVLSVGPDDDGSTASFVELVADAPVRVAFMAGDFSIVTEESPDPLAPDLIVHYLADGTREVIPGVSVLYGIETINGEDSVIAAEIQSDTAESGDILAVGLDTGTIIRLGPAWGPEYGVGSVEWSDTGTAVVSAWSDLTELVSYVDETGAEVFRPSPTDGLPYASPPLVQSAALSPDGRTVVWAEGPDQGYDDAVGDFVLVGDSWVVKGMNLDTGGVEFAMPIDFGGVDPVDSAIDSIHYSETHLVVNRLQFIGDTAVYLAPVIIDMTGAEPAIVPFAVTGNATIFPTGANP